jgi:hypothetical protein
MKYLFILLLGSAVLASCGSSDTDATNNDEAQHDALVKAANDTANYTSIEWLDSTSQHLGKVNEGQVVEISWRFKNTGTKPLIITNATASCGCTVAEKPEAPVAPGAESTIKAKFDSHGRLGPQNKEVYVQANTREQAAHRLTFALEVLKK